MNKVLEDNTKSIPTRVGSEYLYRQICNQEDFNWERDCTKEVALKNSKCSSIL
jgi:hypothetical protein